MNAPVHRVAVYGFESTGKSWLAARLAAHFGVPLVKEYARELWDEKGSLSLDDMLPVAREQWRREDEAAGLCHPIDDKPGLVICDTEALTTMLWSDLLYGTCPAELRAEAERRCRGYALYLLCETDVPFGPDPQRCFPDPEGRARGGQLWREALARRNLPRVEIRGEWDAREQTAVATIRRLCGESPCPVASRPLGG